VLLLLLLCGRVRSPCCSVLRSLCVVRLLLVLLYQSSASSRPRSSSCCRCSGSSSSPRLRLALRAAVLSPCCLRSRLLSSRLRCRRALSCAHRSCCRRVLLLLLSGSHVLRERRLPLRLQLLLLVLLSRIARCSLAIRSSL
jgi:hypothetical protein